VPYPPRVPDVPGSPASAARLRDPLDYLYSLEKLGIKFGLDNIRRMLAALGSPHEAFRSVVIAGTNGKGSVTAMVEHALRAAGFRAARYTSPHLVRLEERFFVDGAPVETGLMRDLAGRVQDVVGALIERGQLETHPTFFEATTAMAFELFRQRGAEIAVCEVGLGGRLDSTNVVTPVATAITSIDLDHQTFLGQTIAEIAYEKAGIIKPGVPVVLGATGQEASRVVERVCREQGARLVRARDEVEVRTTRRPDGRLAMDLTTPAGAYPTVTLGLRGRHQVENAVTAVRLLEQLHEFPVPEAALAAGLSGVNWPGRLDLIEAGQGRSVLLDSAHNPSGAAALAAYLAEFHPAPLPIVFGVMQDKDAEEMLRALRTRASAFVFTAPAMTRATPPTELLAIASRVAPDVPAEASASPAAALEHGWRRGPLLCAAGSIFLVGDLLDLLSRPDV